MSENSFYMTPPFSPSLIDETFLENEPEEGKNPSPLRVFAWFDCLGEVSRTDNRLHPNGYIMSGEVKLLSYVATDIQWKSTINLFGKSFDEGTALQNYNKLLFHLCRKEMLMLDSASKLKSSLINCVPSSQSESNYGQSRKHICEFFIYVRKYFLCVFSRQEYSWIINILVDLEHSLLAVRLYLKNIMDLPEYIIHHSTSLQGNKCSQASYHLFHLHLDLRWHLLMLNLLIDHAKSMTRTYADCFTQNSDNSVQNINSETEKNIKSLITDLIMMAVARFNKIPTGDIKKKSLFSCTCVKELWLLLQFLLDNQFEKGQGKSFWTLVNEILDVIISNKMSEETEVFDCSLLKFPSQISCTNPGIFSVWFLLHLSQLYGYTVEGDYRGQENQGIKSNHQQLQSILRNCLSVDNEVHLRIYLHLLKSLLSWWEPRIEPLSLLWEHFHRRMNSNFFVPGATPDTIAVTCKTGLSFLEQIKGRISDKALEKENSWGMFIFLLGNYLQKCPQYWQQIRGRIYSKFSSSKMQSLTEIGIYHFGSLFLTLAYTTDLKEVSKKLVDFLKLIDLEKLEIQRRLTVWKIYLAVMQLFIEQGQDIENISNPLMEDVFLICKTKDAVKMTLMRTFIEGLQDIVDGSPTLQYSEDKLLGNWIPLYMSSCSSSDTIRALDAFLTVANRMRENASWVSGNHKIINALWEYVLPSVRSFFVMSSDQPFQAADLAAALTMLALDYQSQTDQQTLSFTSLFCSFINVEAGGNTRLLRRFLCHILQEQSSIRALGQQLVDYQSLIIQVWVRCALLSVDERSEEIMNLTRIVSRLPEIHNICVMTNKNLQDQDDPLCTFIVVLGIVYQNLKSLDEKCDFREKCSQYLSSIEKNIPPILKNPSSSNDVVGRIYKVAAVLVSQCGPVIYVKSKPNCLLPTLISHMLLPHAVYNPETKLHPFLAGAIRRTLHYFIKGIAHLHPREDAYICRTLKDIIIQYLVRLSTSASLNVGPVLLARTQGGTHPLINCFDENFEEDIAKFILDTIVDVFLKCRGSIPANPSMTLALTFLADLLKKRNYNEAILSLVIRAALTNLLEITMFIDEKNITKKQSFDIVHSIATNNMFKCSIKLKNEFTEVLLKMSQHHISFSTLSFVKLLVSFCNFAPFIITECLPHLKKVVSSVEHMRGVGYDASLRRSLEKIEDALLTSNKNR